MCAYACVSSVHMCVRARVCVCVCPQHLYAGQRKLAGTDSLFLPCGSRGSNPDHRTCWQMPTR